MTGRARLLRRTVRRLRSGGSAHGACQPRSPASATPAPLVPPVPVSPPDMLPLPDVPLDIEPLPVVPFMPPRVLPLLLLIVSLPIEPLPDVPVDPVLLLPDREFEPVVLVLC